MTRRARQQARALIVQAQQQQQARRVKAEQEAEQEVEAKARKAAQLAELDAHIRAETDPVRRARLVAEYAQSTLGYVPLGNGEQPFYAYQLGHTRRPWWDAKPHSPLPPVLRREPRPPDDPAVQRVAALLRRVYPDCPRALDPECRLAWMIVQQVDKPYHPY